MSKKQQPSKNTFKDLALLFSIPIGIFIIVIGLAYIPRLMANPKYDFVYADCRRGGCGYSSDFGVDNGKFWQKIRDERAEFDRQLAFYYHDVAKDTSRSVSFDELASYTLDSASRSPDGYALKRASGASSGFLFWSNHSDGGWQLEKDILRRPVSIVDNSQYYYGDQGIKLIGWVKK